MGEMLRLARPGSKAAGVFAEGQGEKSWDIFMDQALGQAAAAQGAGMMGAPHPTLAQAARQLADALEAETALARNGALRDLMALAEAKRLAFACFREACATRSPGTPTSESERNALRAVLAAADESALVLDAVQATLGRFLDGVREAASTLADAGTYAPSGRPARHVLAVQIDASV